MKAGKWVVVVFLFLFFNALMAQQTWHGKLSGDTKWSGEIILDGDIIVPKGVSLNIEPGTKIYVLPGTDVTQSGKDKNRAEILVFGSFIANGEPNNRILFTSKSDNPQMNDWYGIILRNKSCTNLINYVTVEYAYVGLTTINCKAIIKNSQFRYNYYTGISAELRSKPIIQNCVLSNNDYAGLKCEYGAMPVVKFSIISGNSHGVIIFNEAEPILGKIEANGEVSGGYNRIFDNFDYNIYNHTYKTIYAQVNNWLTSSADEIRKTIYDRSKDPQYGPVIFEPDQPEFEKRKVLAKQPGRRTATQNQATQQPATKIQPGQNPSANKQPTPENRQNVLTENVNKQQTRPSQPIQDKKTEQPLPDKNTTEQNQLAQTGQTTQQKATELNLAKAEPDKAKMTQEEAPKKEVLQEDPNEVYWSGQKPLLEFQLDNRPKRVKTVQPKYPAGVPRLTKPVRIWLNLTIDMKGNVENVRILKVDGRQEFVQSAVEAARQFKYSVGTLKGKPVRYLKTERIDFMP